MSLRFVYYGDEIFAVIPSYGADMTGGVDENMSLIWFCFVSYPLMYDLWFVKALQMTETGKISRPGVHLPALKRGPRRRSSSTR